MRSWETLDLMGSKVKRLSIVYGTRASEVRRNTGLGHSGESGGWRPADLKEGGVTRKYGSLQLFSATALLCLEREFEVATLRRVKRRSACNVLCACTAARIL